MKIEWVWCGLISHLFNCCSRMYGGFWCFNIIIVYISGNWIVRSVQQLYKTFNEWSAFIRFKIIIKRMVKMWKTRIQKEKKKLNRINHMLIYVERCAVLRIHSSSNINRDFMNNENNIYVQINWFMSEINTSSSLIVSQSVSQSENWSPAAHWFCHKRFDEAVIYQPASAKDRMFGWNPLKMNSFQLFFSLILLHSIWSGVKCTIEHLIIIMIINIVIQAHKYT